MKTSLVKQAETGDLPEQQFMDQETLDWVEVNAYLEDTGQPVARRLLSAIRRFEPNDDWFPDPKRVDALHGKRHLIRVTVYTQLIFDVYKVLPITDSELYLIAASLHDIRRVNDRADEGHAIRTALWFKENVETVNAKYNTELNQLEIDKISYLIEHHESSEYSNDLINVDVLKLADALDRYIQPKKKWWLAEERLKLTPSSELKNFAINLIIKSERNFLKGVASNISVYNALNDA